MGGRGRRKVAPAASCGECTGHRVGHRVLASELPQFALSSRASKASTTARVVALATTSMYIPARGYRVFECAHDRLQNLQLYAYSVAGPLEAVLAKKPKHFSLSFELRTGQDSN